MTKIQLVGRFFVVAKKAGEAASVSWRTEELAMYKLNLCEDAPYGCLMYYWSGERCRSSGTRTGMQIYWRVGEQIVAELAGH